MWTRLSLPVLLAVAGCDRVLGIGDLGGPGDAPSEKLFQDAPAPAAECLAQRAVYLIGGEGGLAWFTLVWPLPAVITGFQPTFSYDDPTLAKDETVDPLHPLFARKIGPRGVWDSLGTHPQPSAIIAGANETHTMQPSSILQSVTAGVAAAGAAAQLSLQPVFPVLEFSPGGPYGTAPNAPAVVSVADVPGAVAAFSGAVSQNVQAQLMPTAAQLASYLPPSPTAGETNLGTQLAFTANAFRLGLINTVMMQAFDDDPHGAFSTGIAAGRANDLTVMLDAFYRDLSTSFETTCGHDHAFLSLADNTAMIVVGDTPKDSFVATGWGDGTAGNANWVYLRSNGFIKPGWFGQISSANARTDFDPISGDLSAVPAQTDTDAAFAAILYTIVRGDMTKVMAITPAPFSGLIQP